MRIANPIYDVVFKYLLEDNQLAKLIVSTIIGEGIMELEFRPQEHTTTVSARSLTVYRIDFAATIKDAQGEYRKVLIEIQKAKFDTDIMRFRRYLGNQYRDPNNVKPTNQEDKGSKKEALPLLTIYFLGHSLEHTTAPVIHVARECYDLTTCEKLNEKETFIESLTHDSYIIQIPHLRHDRRSEIEELLQIFDQGNMSDTDRHILDINEKAVPERYQPLLRRLQRAIVEEQMVEAMDVEDEILEELQDLERKAARALVEKEQALAEKEQERAAKEQALAEKEQERTEKERLLKLLKEAGINLNW